MAVKYAIDENNTQTIHEQVTDSNGDQKKLFNIIKTLLGRQKKLVLPDYSDPITLAGFPQSWKILESHGKKSCHGN